jgi:hypothetical protein
MNRFTKTARRTGPAVLASAAALVMLAGRLIPALRDTPAVVWISALTLLFAALALVLVRRHPPQR